MKILVVNSGSSSVKFSLFETDTETCLANGIVERIRTAGASLSYSNNGGSPIKKKITANSYDEAICHICAALTDEKTGVISDLSEVEAIGHRVVHGGAICDSVQITDEVKQAILDCIPLAPLHNPPNYEGIISCEKLFPGISMTAVFDTAFHQSMPPASYTYAIPGELAGRHRIRRYGFHGTSHKYVAELAASELGRPLGELKLITAHLGNGSSITAIDRGRVVDTSMGMTPLEGLVMGTRSGDIDPAVVLLLMGLGRGREEIDQLLNKQSGLLGLGGIGSNDMRDILQAAEGGNKQAELALEVFMHRLVKYIGAYAAILNGFDALVFTAGIGQHAWRVRELACEKLEFLGVRVDSARNRANEKNISVPDTSPLVFVIPTNEELLIARDTERVLKG